MTNTTNDMITRLASYGVPFEGEQEAYIPAEVHMTLGELAMRKGTIAKVRWIGGDYVMGRGKCYDLSYVQGTLPSGERVSLHHLPAAYLIPRNKRKAAMIEWARQGKVFAKALGLLDEGAWSTLG